MVHTNAMVHEPMQVFTNRAVEPEPADLGLDRSLLLLGEDIDTHETLGSFGGVSLGEIHNVDGGSAGVDERLDGFQKAGFAVRKPQRHGAFGGLNQRCWATGEIFESRLESRGITKRG